MSNKENNIAGAQIDLEAIEERLALTYRICCGTAPKQSVGELLDVTMKMPEWERVRAALARAGQQAPTYATDDAMIVKAVERMNVKCVHPSAATTIDIGRAVLAVERARAGQPATSQPSGAVCQAGEAAGVHAWQERVLKAEQAFVMSQFRNGELEATVADLRAQLASERAAKEYEQRHAAESEKALAEVQVQLASAQKDAAHVAYFRRASEYGPWIECQSNELGATRFTAARAQITNTTATGE